MAHVHEKWRALISKIDALLQKKWSPEIISHHLLTVYDIKFSHTSIYRLINKHRVEWRKYLICKGKRQNETKHKTSATLIPNRVGIEERPSEINERKVFGHFEADTVLSGNGGKSCVSVFVERVSKKYFLIKMPDKTSGSMVAATMKALGKLDIKSLTYDNGSENVQHSLVNNLLNCKSYFCAPYHSWEKGTIENRNKILRQFFPKGTNFDLITENNLRKIEALINDRPMKVLDWRSPNDVFRSLRSNSNFNVPATAEADFPGGKSCSLNIVYASIHA